MAVGTLKVKGYKEFLRASNRAGKESKKAVRVAFRRVGEHIRVSAASRFAPTDPRSASGYRVVVRVRGIAVEQSIRKTTGLHPEYGALQMRRALLPALAENEARTVLEMERAMDEVADHFERTP